MYEHHKLGIRDQIESMEQSKRNQSKQNKHEKEMKQIANYNFQWRNAKNRIDIRKEIEIDVFIDFKIQRMQFLTSVLLLKLQKLIWRKNQSVFRYRIFMAEKCRFCLKCMLKCNIFVHNSTIDVQSWKKNKNDEYDESKKKTLEKI